MTAQPAQAGEWQSAAPPLGMTFDSGHVDPYLVWFEYTGYESVNPAYVKLPVMVELSKPWSAHPQPVHLELDGLLSDGLPQADASRFVNRFVARNRLIELVRLQASGLIARFQLAAPRGNPIPPLQRFFEDDGIPGGDVFGVIDDGCCVANTMHWTLEANASISSRFAWIWDQDPRAVLEPPWLRPGIDGSPERDSPGYGLQTNARRLGRSLKRLFAPHAVSERDYYGKVLGRERWGRQGRTHGARVVNRLTGHDEQTPVVFVQLPEATVGDASGGSLGFYVVDGARYIVERARRKGGHWQAVINVSVGSIAGPHDGTTITEKALDELVTIEGGRSVDQGEVRIVIAAGNTSGLGIHAKHAIKNGADGSFDWLVRPGNVDEAYLEVWFPETFDDGALVDDHSGGYPFWLEVQTPGSDAPHRVAMGEARVLKDERGKVVASVVIAKRVSQGLRGTMALIALRPTERRIGSDASVAPCGVWRVAARSSAPQAATIHAWVERNEIIIGRRSGQRTRLVGAGVCDDHTLGSIAHGERTDVVGGYRIRMAEEAAYSALGPVRRAGAAAKPQHFGPSDESPWLPGVRVRGFFSGTLTRLSGTSAAAPRIARWIADGRRPQEIRRINRRDETQVDGIEP